MVQLPTVHLAICHVKHLKPRNLTHRKIAAHMPLGARVVPCE